MRQADAVSVSVVVTVDPPTAFDLFTEDVDLWWRRGPAYRAKGGTLRFDPGVGGRLVETSDEEGGAEYVIGRVKVWDRAKRLRFEFRGPNFQADQSTDVDVRFEALGHGTRVTVEHGGWSSLPLDHPVRHGLANDDFYRMWAGWWHHQFIALRGRT